MEIDLTVKGTCDPAFSRVREVFAAQVEAGEGSGEAVAVVVDGKTVVDLWGGYRDKALTQPWAEDTMVCLYSIGKSVAASTGVTEGRGGIHHHHPALRLLPCRAHPRWYSPTSLA